MTFLNVTDAFRHVSSDKKNAIFCHFNAFFLLFLHQNSYANIKI